MISVKEICRRKDVVVVVVVVVVEGSSDRCWVHVVLAGSFFICWIAHVASGSLVGFACSRCVIACCNHLPSEPACRMSSVGPKPRCSGVARMAVCDAAAAGAGGKVLHMLHAHANCRGSVNCI